MTGRNAPSLEPRSPRATSPATSAASDDNAPRKSRRVTVVSLWRQLSRLRAHSWVVEVAIFLVLAVLYTLVRAAFVGSEATAVAHAHQVLSLEGALLHAIEKSSNSWLTGEPAFAVAACYFYALMHYVATPVVLIVSRRRGGRQYWRGYAALMVASGVAVLVYALYPVAPPRLVPDLGIVDVMRTFSHYGWWGDAASAPRGIGDATNQFAAMPSMHFGWALWCAVQMWGFGGVVWRRLAVLYPAAIAVVVVATGNHFVLDVLAGGACVVAAYAAVTAVGRRLQHGGAAAPAQIAGSQHG